MNLLTKVLLALFPFILIPQSYAQHASLTIVCVGERASVETLRTIMVKKGAQRLVQLIAIERGRYTGFFNSTGETSDVLQAAWCAPVSREHVHAVPGSHRRGVSLVATPGISKESQTRVIFWNIEGSERAGALAASVLNVTRPEQKIMSNVFYGLLSEAIKKQ